MMSIISAVTIDQKKLPLITKSDLLRLEGLGDNCEFGFVLRRLGFEDGMLFRWASIRPESLLATLRGNFAELYEFNNLVPQNSKMVRDLHYGTSWHTQMYSSLRAGTLTFDFDEERRRRIHAKEASKLAYLLQKLGAKFEHPNPVFVIKANNNISPDLLEAIHYQIYRRVTSSRFLLLEVQENIQRAGTCELLNRNWMRGFVTRFAPYDKADEGDDATWLKILSEALAHNANEPLKIASPPTVSKPEIISLQFSYGLAPDVFAPMLGDLRGGVPLLVNDNGWCRKIDENVYRLHATASDTAATRLEWTGVYLPPGYRLRVNAACAIEESLPVRATLKVFCHDGISLQTSFIFDGTREQVLSLAGPTHLANPLTISLSVEPVLPLKTKELAVIDISSILAAPLDEAVAQ